MKMKKSGCAAFWLSKKWLAPLFRGVHSSLWDGVDTQWEIFVAYIIKPNTIYHISTAFTDDQHFADVMNQTIEYAKTVKPSNADPDVTIKPSDQVLTLSTCTYEYDDSFFAVMARRIK